MTRFSHSSAVSTNDQAVLDGVPVMGWQCFRGEVKSPPPHGRPLEHSSRGQFMEGLRSGKTNQKGGAIKGGYRSSSCPLEEIPCGLVSHYQKNPSVRKIVSPQFWGQKWLRKFYGRLEKLRSFCRNTPCP